MLSVRDLHVRYGHAHILQGVSLDTGRSAARHRRPQRHGQDDALLCAIMGWSQPERRRDHARPQANRRARRAPGWRRMRHRDRAAGPPGLPLAHRRRASAPGRAASAAAPGRSTRVYDTFPRLAERRKNRGSQLSGGEQQMLAISRALLMNPRLVIMDEPSEGLAPVIVEQLVDVLSRPRRATASGFFLVEQNLQRRRGRRRHRRGHGHRPHRRRRSRRASSWRTRPAAALPGRQHRSADSHPNRTDHGEQHVDTDWKTTLDHGLENIGSFGKTAPAPLPATRQLHAAGRAVGPPRRRRSAS